MAFLRERLNLFSGSFRVAPRPLVPEHWDAPDDHPSATRFWVDPTTGATSWQQEADHWEMATVLKHWHFRQASRVWACKRLVDRFGLDEAQRRVADLQLEIRHNVKGANAYLDLLITITYEACLLTRNASIDERRLVSTALQAKRAADALGEASRVLTVSAGSAAAEQAVAATQALDQLIKTLSNTVSPMDTRFDPGHPLGNNRLPNKEVWEWVGYITPSRKYRQPDLRWMLAAAVVIFRDSKPDFSAQKACDRVGGYLAQLDAPLGRMDDSHLTTPSLSASSAPAC